MFSFLPVVFDLPIAYLTIFAWGTVQYILVVTKRVCRFGPSRSILYKALSPGTLACVAGINRSSFCPISPWILSRVDVAIDWEESRRRVKLGYLFPRLLPGRRYRLASSLDRRPRFLSSLSLSRLSLVLVTLPTCPCRPRSRNESCCYYIQDSTLIFPRFPISSL